MLFFELSHKKSLLHYRPDIDSLRAIAVGLVLGFHAFPVYLPGGFIGVDIFFVISGFLISGIILKEQARGEFSYMGFYLRRCRRILPALISVLLVTWLVGVVFLLPDEFANLGRHVIGGTLFYSNILLWQESGYFDSASELKPLLHLWSLGIEEQFYLLWPTALVLLWKRARIKFGIIVLLLGSFFLNIFLVREGSAATFYLLPTRLWELLIGALLAGVDGKNVPHRKIEDSVFFSCWYEFLGICALGLIFAGAFLVTKSAAYPGWLGILPTFAAALYMYVGCRAWCIRALTIKPILLVGIISYPLYLWHWPILSFLTIINAGQPLPTTRIVAVLFAVFLALLTWRYIELPVQRRRLFSVRTFALILGSMAFLGFCAQRQILAPIMNISLTQRAKLDDLIEHYGQNYVATFEDIRASECRKIKSCNCRGEGDCRRVSAEPVVVLWGDSHAEHLFPGLEQLAQQNFRLVPIFTECVPVAGVFETQNSEQCIARNRQALHAISELKPDVVIIAARWKNVFDSNRFLEKTNQTLREIKPFAGRTLLIGPVPEWSPDMYKIIAKEYLRNNIPAPLHLKKGLVQTSFLIEREMVKNLDGRDASYVSLISQLCDDSGCRTHVTNDLDSNLMVWDYGHFTKEGSSLVANMILGPKLALSAR